MPSHNKISAEALAAVVERVKAIRDSDTYLTSVPLSNITFVDGGQPGNHAIFTTSDVALSAAPAATFDVVAMIARSGHVTTPGGTADITSRFSDQQEFTKSKIKFNAAAPDHLLLSDIAKNDWIKVGTVLNDIQRRDDHFDYRSRNIQLTNQVEGNHFTLNHRLLLLKTDVDTASSDSSSTDNSDNDANINVHESTSRSKNEANQHHDDDAEADNSKNAVPNENELIEESLYCEVKDWPASDDWHKSARRCNATDTHVVCKLPAYDLDGNLMDPSRYSKDLPGATAHIRFTLNNRVVNREDNVRKILMTAIIHHVRVLLPPTKLQTAPAFATPPVKRKDTQTASSSKKTRCA